MQYLSERMGTIDRRHFIGLASATGVLAATGLASAAGRSARWSNPSTWGGRVPGRRDVARVRGRVLLDTDARVAGVRIEPGGVLVFQPGASRTLRTAGNVVVHGKLVMKPDGPSIVHRLVFVGVDEERFVGGGHDVLASDVGLWVMHHARIDLSGTPKRAWARVASAADAGATTIEVDAAPDGWVVGDEVAIAPSASPGAPNHRDFHVAKVASISGNSISLDTPLADDHPVATSSSGESFAPEVLNLTRNVRIEGTKKGRAHIFIHAHLPQRIRYASVRHTGPRRQRGSFSKSVLGRYGIHFHHSYNGSRGSLVEGTVVRDCGNHCFVPHTSHGVRFAQCIAFDALESPYWWDEGDITHDTTWEDCVAARVEADDQTVSHDLTGFFLGRGNGNTARRCTAVGVGGRLTASGFQWPPEPANGVWTFEDCIAHNNAADGIFVWQRISDVNVIDRFTAYRNGKAGIEHGSFLNSFAYSDSLLLENGHAGIILHANSARSAEGGLTFSSLRMDGGPIGVDIVEHTIATPDPVRFLDCSFGGGSQVAVRLAEQGGEAAGKQDFLRCTVAGERDLEPDDFLIQFMAPTTQLRVQRRDRSAFKLETNGDGSPIPPFE
jgi:hypothetical protein